MESTNPSFSTRSCRLFSLTTPRPARRLNLLTVAAGGGTGRRDYWGRLVDEDMIVLRWRIREMKMLETEQDSPPNWMEWEKQYFMSYNEDICEALRVLQNFLMSTRPSLVFGMIALVVLCVLTTSGITLFHAIEIASRILSGFRQK